jgi:hypothetical protein
MLTIVELPDILSDVCASNASMALNVHVVAEGHNDGLDLGRKFAGGGKDESYGTSI